MSTVDPSRTARLERIIQGFRGRGLEQAAADPQLRKDLEDEAASPDPNRLVPPDLLHVLDLARDVQSRPELPLGLFFSTDDVIIIPGFLGSELDDVTGGLGVIWIDPKIVVAGAGELLNLKLDQYEPGKPDRDAVAGVTVRPNGAIPLIYAGLRYDLEVRRYSVQVFGFDWRKHVDESAAQLAGLIRDRATRRFRPLHLIAHSQGTLVARRAVQMLGAQTARQLVSNLVLLGPATAGTFSAAFALAGDAGLIETVAKFGIEPPPGFPQVLQSMTGLYQLLPWRTDPASDLDKDDQVLQWVRDHRDVFDRAGFWQTGVDAGRLADLYGWGHGIDASFLNDRTMIILGDRPTVGGVEYQGGKLVATFSTPAGDGTVPDALARVEGVTRVFKARGAEHLMLPATLEVLAAVRDVLAGRTPQVDRVLGAAAPGTPFLARPEDPAEALPRPRPVPVKVTAPPRPGAPAGPPAEAPVPPGVPPGPAVRPTEPAWQAQQAPAPPQRRLRVFSFDPLFATELESLGTELITLALPWDFADGNHLEPGPVGEYVEVVDYDPASGCFYPPVDLNHPYLLAQDGLPVSEGDPRFHQQMAYAVAMATIHQFELALGRVALWAPHLRRDAAGEVIPSASARDEYVQRLRIYPHALRQANAYYHPGKKALLLGYFLAGGTDVGRNLPQGTVFASLSYDIIAHETTHALLDGLHRYFTEPSNPDVFAFHEAFADVVALFQHFSHPEVLRRQIAQAKGDLQGQSMLGALAAQFGEAMGSHGALRQYLGRWNDAAGKWEPIPPDKAALGRTSEPHARGAILVAALFRAFANIYENRVGDLRRLATGGTGILPAGDLPPDLVNRMADEAAKAARHMLTMCVRALDYIPPVDITFGEYLRALVTADFDLVRDDDLCYRTSVVSAFRDWGIYPGDVRSLSIDSLLWCPPEVAIFQHAPEVFSGTAFECWCAQAHPSGGGGRLEAYETMWANNQKFHQWLKENLGEGRDQFLGLALGPDAPRSIRRDPDGRPVFQVFSMSRCRRIGPDGQERSDIVVELVQRRKAFFDEVLQQQVDRGDVDGDTLKPDFYFRGGCTLVIDPETWDIRYCIRKSVLHDGRLRQERRFRQGQFGDKVGGLYLGGPDDGNPFAFLHGAV